MQFLSIAGRELRVAARKPASFHLRMFTSCVALLVAGFALWFVTFFDSRPTSGENLFLYLSRVGFLCACVVGPALTADSINEERNNGTLGLLFLTNLRPVSISFGKLVGHGLLALYSIVSILPVMALPAILGGTDVPSLAKTALVLFVTLALSLIVGMFASLVCRKTWMAAALALFILAIFVLGIPVAALLLRFNHRPEISAWLELFSPTYSLSMANTFSAMLPSNHLWLALGIQTLVALGFFALINLFLPRVWQEGNAGRKTRSIQAAWNTFRHGSGAARRRLRLRLLQWNPILWLSARQRFGPMGFALLLLVLAFVISRIGRHIQPGPTPDPFIGQMIAWIAGMPLLYLAFCFRFAAAASERFALDRKAGALELILCTPIKTREIIRGHWLGLLRKFWGAAVLLLALHAFVLHYIMEAIQIEGSEVGFGPFGLRRAITDPLQHLFGTVPIPNNVAPLYIACLAVLTAAILIVILWIALGWLGMALSLKLRREILAPWISLLLLAVPPIPVFVCSVALLDDKDLFASNLFLAMLRLGVTGFSIVLTNALLWLLLARRWTYQKLRPTGGPTEAPGASAGTVK